MKVITMESSAYQALTEQIAEIAKYVRKDGNGNGNGYGKQEAATDRLIGTNEAARLLNVSKRTLQRMRDEHRIKYAVFRGKCQYRLSDINRLLESCTIKEDAATPEALKHNYSLRMGKDKG
ncbi:MAG: helix-turn-helix domain-containing protein [Parabacteroides sp.]|nr:helix-turn-helix domain-containing protein [Parabacteroides sp.]